MRELVEWISNRGGIVDERDVLTGRRNIKTMEYAGLALQNLVDAELGDWLPSPPGKPGRPKRSFHLHQPVSDCRTSINPSRNGNCADADTADKQETTRLQI